jgi:hypothetical protein
MNKQPPSADVASNNNKNGTTVPSRKKHVLDEYQQFANNEFDGLFTQIKLAVHSYFAFDPAKLKSRLLQRESSAEKRGILLISCFEICFKFLFVLLKLFFVFYVHFRVRFLFQPFLRHALRGHETPQVHPQDEAAGERRLGGHRRALQELG